MLHEVTGQESSLGDIDAAEEAVQDAFTAAVQRWPSAGLPPSPAGWIITTARNRAIDRLRREASREGRHAEAALPQPAANRPGRVPCAMTDQLLSLAPSPVVALNRAVAVAEVEGPGRA
jgi:RNA polymerase sigma-70 factor (ECF subfamily)